MVRFLISFVAILALIFGLNKSWSIQGSAIPPLGKFLSPSIGFWQQAEKSKASDFQQLTLSTPSGNEVEVIFDERLVPHIFAQNDRDAYYAQGYITAGHRLWQMDLSTRATAGRLSEILGPRLLSYDRGRRQLGLPHAAKIADKKWSQDPSYELLKSYTSGINAYISELGPSEYPLEYKILDFTPEEWTPYRTALFIKNMASMLGSAERDVQHTQMMQLLGKDVFQDLFPMRFPDDSPIVSADHKWAFDPIAFPDDTMYYQDVGKIEGKSSMPNRDQLGSNNWAVSGAKTKSGAPILCSDPHLQLTLPSIWYECHIVTPEYNCYGVSLPGVPGIIIGFNEHIAWGITNAGHDVKDWYRIDWTDQSKTEYWLDGKKEKVNYEIEEYHVKNQKPIIDTIRYTKWGPVSMNGVHQDMAMKWLPMESPLASESAVFNKLNRAKNHDDYMAALDHFVAPAQNFVFASTEGDIAIRVGGQLPLRKVGQGIFVQDGSSSRNDWPGRIPVRHNPHQVNPARNFVSSANQVSTAPSYPYFYHGEPYFEDYRGRWLNRQLSKMNQIEVKDMMSLQYDHTSLKAKEILPVFMTVIDTLEGLSENENEIRSKLGKWDGKYAEDLEAPSLFETWYDQYYETVWDEFMAIKDSLPIGWPQSWKTIDLSINNPTHAYFDIQGTPNKIEGAHDVVVISFRKMAQIWEEKADDKKIWGLKKNTTIAHFANIPGMSKRLPNAPGHGDALNATTSTHGPSWRMVVEMTTPINAWVVYPGGQPGNPGHPQYDEMTMDWQDGNYHQAHFSRSKEELIKELKQAAR